jgi:hypothetical protein
VKVLSISKGKFFDARKTRDYCDRMKAASEKYWGLADITSGKYDAFNENPLFRGITATALKGFINNRMGGMLKQVVSLQDQMIKDQEYLISNFELMVDSHKDARIENDTLEMINADFKGYYFEFDGYANEVKKLVNDLNSEFGHYAYFPQPDSDSARTQFWQICGAEDDEAGYFRSCQKKFEAFDQAIYTYLKGRDTVERKTDLDTRISKTTDQLTAYTPLSVDPPQETLERIGVGL